MIIGCVFALISLGLLYAAKETLTKVLAGFVGVVASATFAIALSTSDHYLVILLYGLANLIGMLLSIWRK